MNMHKRQTDTDLITAALCMRVLLKPHTFYPGGRHGTQPPSLETIANCRSVSDDLWLMGCLHADTHTPKT